MHKWEFLPTPLLHSELKNLEISIVTVFFPVQKAFYFFYIYFQTFFVIALFHFLLPPSYLQAARNHQHTEVLSHLLLLHPL